MDCFEDTNVRGVAGSEVITGKDDESGINGISEALGERFHVSHTPHANAYPLHAAQMPALSASAARAASAKSSAKTSLGGMDIGCAKPWRINS